ncbi:uncharacterized protein LOC142549363 isoform X1 [Primulina tabacum]|uniref:uncharacterized protein LOC142549363 isoform X1 n=3 Tax=Primulina tabacum TaxID=48773 RepID=UPI003F5A40D8
MAIVTGDQYLESLVKFVENQAERLIEGTLVLKLNPVGLRYVQSRLEALEELESLISGAPVDYLRAYVSDLGDHRALEQLRRILRLLPSLKVVSVLPSPGRDPTPLYLLPFGCLKVLELRGCDLSTSAAKGLLELRFTLEKLICHKSADALRHVFSTRIVEIKDSPQWNRLCFVSCACNGLILMDEALQLLPVVETLDLSRNKFSKVDNLYKCSKLKHLDLGFNNLRSISSFGEVPCQIVKLDLRNNALSTLHGIENLRSLEGLDLSYNVISNFWEVQILAGLPSLQNLWLEGNPLCCARWFRAQVFSFFPLPHKLKLDDKRISPSEFWKRQIIVTSRMKQPASFGFYVPAKDDANSEGINAKRKCISRVVSIGSEKQFIRVSSDSDSMSCDNEIQSKDENAISDDEAEIEHMMKRIELRKKEHSIQWLQEFKEWMDQTSGNVDGNNFRSNILSNNKEIHANGKLKDKNLGETSKCISDTIQLSGDESSTMMLESETSFADTSPVVNSRRHFDRNSDTTSKLFLMHQGRDGSVANNLNGNPEELRSLNDESADAVYSRFNSLVSGEDNISTENLISPSNGINSIMRSRSSSACPTSPPHYQEDILHRRQNLEEELLQLSAESFSGASSDSNSSCSEDDSAEFDTKIIQVNQSFDDNIYGGNAKDYSVVSNPGDIDHDTDPPMKQKGTLILGPFARGKYAGSKGREFEISIHASSDSITDSLVDDDIVNFHEGESDFLQKNKCRRKPRRRMVSLPEDDDAHGDIDSSNKFSDHVQIYKNDIESEGKELFCSNGMWKFIPVRINGDDKDPIVHNCYLGVLSGLNTSSKETNNFIETYFNSKIADSGVGEISVQLMLCCCLFPGRSSYYERDVAVLRSSERKLYILLVVGACEGPGDTSLEIVGCHSVGDVREVFVGLGLQVVRVHFEGNSAYVFITNCMKRSRELLGVFDILDSLGIKDHCSLTSLEQVQINLFKESVFRGSEINIFQYSIVFFWHDRLEDDMCLPRSLFVLDGCLILCAEDLSQFGTFSPSYFSLDSCGTIANVSEMVIDTMNNLLIILLSECTSEFHPSEKACRTEDSALENKKPASDPLTWKLKWFSKDAMLNFVPLLKAIHAQATASPLVVRYK